MANAGPLEIAFVCLRGLRGDPIRSVRHSYH